MTWLELLLLCLGILLWVLCIRLHAELVATKEERDDALRQLKALVMVYRRGVDTRRDRR